jgi:hypothetical protein
VSAPRRVTFGVHHERRRARREAEAVAWVRRLVTVLGCAGAPLCDPTTGTTCTACAAAEWLTKHGLLGSFDDLAEPRPCTACGRPTRAPAGVCDRHPAPR